MPAARIAPFRYRAFLSYAHADRREAERLHRALEKTRLDRDLVGRATPMGQVPARLAPIFRDREDFSGGHSLTDATLAALDASAALIVVASPNAAKSHYVNEEVRLFRARHPDRPVIPVIIAGEAGGGVKLRSRASGASRAPPQSLHHDGTWII